MAAPYPPTDEAAGQGPGGSDARDAAGPLLCGEWQVKGEGNANLVLAYCGPVTQLVSQTGRRPCPTRTQAGEHT